MIFEGRQLIDNHHVEVKGKAGLVNEPLQVFTVDDRDVRLLHEGGFSLLRCPDCDRIGKTVKVLPFFYFRWPSIAGDS